MKKIISVLLIAILLCCFIFSSFAEEAQDSIHLDSTGITVALTDAMKNAKGQIQGMDSGEIGTGIGIYTGGIVYLAVTPEEIDAFKAELEGLDLSTHNEENDQKAQETMNKYQAIMSSVAGVCNFMTVTGGRTLEEAGAGLLGDEVKANYNIYDLGTLGENHYYMLMFKKDSGMIEKTQVPDALKDEYYAIMTDPDSILANITLNEPNPPQKEELGFDTLSFEAKDLDGNTVDLSEVFASHEVTMVNFWATYCEPCKKEFPELVRMNAELAEKDCAIIGVCTDIRDGKTEKAKQILADTGVDYLNLYISAETGKTLGIESMPTSFFVNREGKIVTEPIVGAYIDGYRSMFDKALEAGTEK